MKAVVVHSGGMDSSICLALAIKEFGREQVLSLSFRYGQRHSVELEKAAYICQEWQVKRKEIQLECFQEITDSALLNGVQAISQEKGKTPNTIVIGRNGVMAHLAGIHAHQLGANCIYMGIMELEVANSGYRDCSRTYMNLMEQLLRMDLDTSHFAIRTPLSFMTKLQSLYLADELGVLSFLREHTISCYQGIPGVGCKHCPACQLRNAAFAQWDEKQAGR